MSAGTTLTIEAAGDKGRVVACKHRTGLVADLGVPESVDGRQAEGVGVGETHDRPNRPTV